jgi:hypothetical protein
LERSCWLFGVARSALGYHALHPVQDAALVARMQRLAGRYPDWGYLLAHGYARERSWAINYKRLHRL